MRIHLLLAIFFSFGSKLQAAPIILHEENFENCLGNSWTVVAGIDDEDPFDSWVCAAFEGNHYIEMNGFEGQADEEWLISPAIDLNSTAQEFFTFNYRDVFDGPPIELFYSLDYNGIPSTTDVANAHWNVIPLDLYDISDDEYLFNWLPHKAIDISQISGSNVYFAFKYTGSAESAELWQLDNILIIADYYDAIEQKVNDGLDCAALKTALSALIDQHTRIEYSGIEFDVWDAFFVTDRRINDEGTREIVYDMFSDNPVGAEAYEFVHGPGRNKGETPTREGQSYNREHTFPSSWWGGGDGLLDTQYTDLHFIVPSDAFMNLQKANYPLGETDNAVFTGTNGSKIGPPSAATQSPLVFEPIDAYKGDFARMYFYVATRYENAAASWKTRNEIGTHALSGNAHTVFEPWLLRTLLKWHESDPVSTKEIERNNAIFAIQHNRNPFIDHPEYASAIWGTSSGEACDVLSAVEPVNPGRLSPFDFDLYPNPARDKIFLSFGQDRGLEKSTLRIFTSGGKILSTQKFPIAGTVIEYSLPQLPPGLYFLEISVGGQSFYKKFCIN